MNQPSISVCLITYNHQKYIAAAIESILKQTYSDFELVIVDDDSKDQTANIIHQFKDSRIRYFHQANQGPSGALNTAIKNSKAPFIAQMSGDDICYPTRLEEQLACFANSEELKICFSHVECIDEEGNELKNHRYLKVFNQPNRLTKETFQKLF